MEEFAELIINHENRIRRLEEQEEESMVGLQDVQDQVNALVAEDSAVVAALNDLKQKADSGQQVTAADLQGLHDQLATEVGRLSDAVQATDPAPDQPDPSTQPVDVSPNPATQAPDAQPTDTTPVTPDASAPATQPTTTPAGGNTPPSPGALNDSSGNPTA